MKKPIYLLLFFLFSTFPVQVLHAATAPDETGYQEKIKNLESLLISINHVSAKIAATQKILQSTRGIGREQQLKAQINELSLKLKDMEENFNQLSTDVDFAGFQAEQEKEMDWNQQLKELLGPLMGEVKRMTSRPRKIEKLRRNIELHESQLLVTQKGSEKVLKLLSHAKSPQLIQKLNSIMRVWQNREQEIRTQMNIATQQLEQELSKRRSLSQTFQDFLRTLFKSRGRNLIFALLAFFLPGLSFAVFIN